MVVDFPLPAWPVISIRPLFSATSFIITSRGKLSSSKDGISVFIALNVIAIEFLCL